MEDYKVKFVRIRGRIVPMRIDPKTKQQTEGNLKDIITKLNVVDAKTQAEKYRYKDHLITNEKQLFENNQLNWLEKRQLKHVVNIAEKGENAFSMHGKPKHFVFTPSQVNKHALAHEIGHTRDFAKNGYNQFLDDGLIGALTGRTLKMEKRAWEMAPGKNTKARQQQSEYALDTYRKLQRDVRVGTAALGGIVFLQTLPLFFREPSKVKVTKGVKLIASGM